MAGRPPRRGPPDDWVPGQVLDWSDRSHWGGYDAPCRYCGKPTPLRDSKGSASHKVCAEEALTRQHAEAADAYENERHLH